MTRRPIPTDEARDLARRRRRGRELDAVERLRLHAWAWDGVVGQSVTDAVREVLERLAAAERRVADLEAQLVARPLEEARQAEMLLLHRSSDETVNRRSTRRREVA